MIESQWLAASDPTPMLEFLNGKVSDRKLRLFCCACCRRTWSTLAKEQLRTAVEVAELYADDQINRTELMLAANNAAKLIDFDNDTISTYLPGGAAFICAVPKDCAEYESYNQLQFASIDAAYHAADDLANKAAKAAALMPDGEWDKNLFNTVHDKTAAVERLGQVYLASDIFGNPFRFITVDPAWLTSTAVALAHGIYDDKAFDRLPILADALQDAGCENADFLNHLRNDGPHVRGCWALDLVLGKQ